MTIAMCLPLAITFAVNTAKRVHKSFFVRTWNKILFYLFPHKSVKIHQRFIRHSTVTSTKNYYSYSSNGLGDNDTQNEILIKAIQLYVDAHGLLKLTNADLELRSFDNGKKRNGYYSYYQEKTNTVADTLSEYKVVKKPIPNSWFSLGNFENDDEETVKGGEKPKEHKVDMVIIEDNQDSEDDNKKSQKKETILQFRSEGKKSIDNFINKAYQWYLGELRKLEDDSRHMYELITKKDTQENDNSPEKYKRYQLSDDKTFESLFFQQKDDVLKVVDHFTNKTGKYAIKGYPHKLGLLLHGPPGTGKTSMIKALAQHTGRSIVNIPLSRISTNAELASIFFDQKFNVEGERLPVQLSFKDIIFVMEDIDAVSKIVRRRDGKKTSDVTYTEQIEMPITKSLWTMMLESTNSSCQELVAILLKKSDRLKKAASDPTTLTSSARRLTTVPGLSLVGEDIDNEAVGKAAMEALTSAKKLMNDYRTVGDFIGTHATTLKQIIETGAEITEDFEDELLGLAVNEPSSSGLDSFLSLKQPSLTTKVKTKQYGEEDDNIHVETSDTSSFDCEEAMLVKEEAMEFSASTSSSKTGGKQTDSTTSSWFKKKDELNLAGILNVLDGVVDTPSRMLIITTNHPEMLDPALIRPGRIDKKLFLGYISASDLVNMIEHYFQTSLNEDQIRRLETAIGSGTDETAKAALKLTPAQVEQMASEFEDVEDMIEAVECKSLHVPRKSENKPRIVYGA